MGVLIHKAVIATTFFDDNELKEINDFIYKQASEIVLLFTISKTATGYSTVVMSPDGSKERFATSIECAEVRKEFVELVSRLGIPYIEVEFGETGQRIVSGNNEDMYS